MGCEFGLSRLAVPGEVFDALEDVLVIDAEFDEDLIDQVEPGAPGGLPDVLSRCGVDGDDDGGDLAVAGGQAQGAADGLDDVDGAGLGVGEQEGVDGGDVDAFGAAAAVGQHGPARLGGIEALEEHGMPGVRHPHPVVVAARAGLVAGVVQRPQPQPSQQTFHFRHNHRPPPSVDR
ncbi:hypothetical protein [Streptomyces sp. NPDC005336]|uniref:hypothetical protein n=1 Tax=Streptomyces sp. NPDC005336 TaxID=3157035 RepID=UPI00339E521A